MRRGKVVRASDERYETDAAGRVKMMDKRMIRYHEFSFPVQEALPVGDTKLMTYKYPSENPKARVLFIHGMLDYAGRYAYLG